MELIYKFFACKLRQRTTKKILNELFSVPVFFLSYPVYFSYSNYAFLSLFESPNFFPLKVTAFLHPIHLPPEVWLNPFFTVEKNANCGELPESFSDAPFILWK